MLAKVYKSPVNKPGVHAMYDYWLVYPFNNRVYAVRIDATFKRDFRFLVKLATDTTWENIKKMAFTDFEQLLEFEKEFENVR